MVLVDTKVGLNARQFLAVIVVAHRSKTSIFFEKSFKEP